jgi:hypothetical protein
VLNASGLQLVDLNNDQKLDLLSLTYNGGWAVFAGNGDGTFQSAQALPSRSNGTSAVVIGFPKDGALAVVDFNVDALSGELVISTFRPTTLSVSPTLFDFGARLVGSRSAPQNFTLTNIGTLPVEVTAIRFSGSVGSYPESDNCVGGLSAGASCTITLTLQPAAVGTLPLTIEIDYVGTTGSPQSIELLGIGQPVDGARAEHL